MKKLAALFLALALILGIMPMTLAEEVPTLTVLRIGTDRQWVPDTSNNQKLMEILGVKKHYVTKDGTQRIEL